MMTSKSEVNEMLQPLLGNEEFVKLWWGLRLPGLGRATPNEIWDEDPGQVVEYVKTYRDG